MQFIDEVTLHLKAGRGGDGVVRWLHEKGKEYGGPSGGNAGKGGDVIARAVRDVGILSMYRNVKAFEADRGEDGMKDRKQGGEGKDIELKFPVGSKFTNLTTGYERELLESGERVKLLSGGRGGLGNEHFKSSTNIRPKEFTHGEDGEEADFHIELLMIVDIGIIGLPNAGKSSLINVLTNSKSRVGDFPFTTLEPALGDFYGFIVADIHGLVEGASQGRGLGHKFLRHIERTRTLVHCVSSELQDPIESYKIVRKELELYNEATAKKPEIVVLTKVDLLEEEERNQKISMLKTIAPNVFPLSIIDDKLIKDFGDYLVKNLENG